jgi:hypothetical protein
MEIWQRVRRAAAKDGQASLTAPQAAERRVPRTRPQRTTEHFWSSLSYSSRFGACTRKDVGGSWYLTDGMGAVVAAEHRRGPLTVHGAHDSARMKSAHEPKRSSDV